jgi:hypothetical protein
MSASFFRLRPFPRLATAVAWMLLLGLLLGWRPAMAAQTPPCASSPTTATLTLPTASITPGQPNGLVGSPAQVSVNFDCVPAFFQTDNLDDTFKLHTGNFAPMDANTAPPGGVGVMFTTNMPGIDVLLKAQQRQADDGNNGPDSTIGWIMGSMKCHGYSWSYYCNPKGNFSGTVTFTAQLVKWDRPGWARLPA